MKFEIGDRVRSVVDAPDGKDSIHIGSCGTVCSTAWCYGVEWDDVYDCHDCGGACEYGHGWNVKESDIELIEQPIEFELNDSMLDILMKGSLT